MHNQFQDSSSVEYGITALTCFAFCPLC